MTSQPENQAANTTPPGGLSGGAIGAGGEGESGKGKVEGGKDGSPAAPASAEMYCRACRYPLLGLDSRRCPECGQPFDPGNPRTYFATLRTSRPAIAALVLALLGLPTIIVGLGLLFWVLALILARRALNEIDRAEGGIPGRGLARAAAGIASLSLAAAAVVGVIVMVAALASFTRVSGNMPEAARVRGVVNALTLWSGGHTTTGDFPKVGAPGYAYPDNSVVNRLNAMCNDPNDPLPPKKLISPRSSDTPWQGTGPVSLASTNISFSLLDAGNPEWKNSQSAEVPLVCDKRVGQGSAWNKTKWEGFVGWGDVHTDYQQSQIVPTVMGGVTYPQDDLWAQSSTNDALMIDP